MGAIATALIMLTTPAVAQQPSLPAHVLSREDLGAWLDGYLPYTLQVGDVAGAVVVVVKDGEVLLQKGFGYADVGTRRPVNPETTLFRPGSISKLITWTAVMQQVERGRIELDGDINRYLDFRIPPFEGRPITMRNLMTHTPGFEYSLRDLVSADPKGPPPLGEYLKGNLPKRIFLPGQVPAYSNYGVALAGYIVQRVSGESFDDYVERHIFAPLRMQHASFRQPLPAQLQPEMASGYARASDPPKPYEMFAVAPAGSAAVTGEDMAKFMIAHLQDGEYGGQRVLETATARTMHDSALTTISPSLNRMVLGFFQVNRNGHRIIGHEGDSIWFHSALHLYLDDHVGLFLSLNSIGRDGAARSIRKGLIDGFADRYFPGPKMAVTPVSPSVAAVDAAKIAGRYDSSLQEPSTFLSLLELFTQETLTADSAGHIFASGITRPNGQPETFEEVAPFIWRGMDSDEQLAAKLVDGRVMWAASESSPDTFHIRTANSRDAAWLLPLLGASLVALLLTTVLWPINALIRRRYNAPFPLQGFAVQAHRWLRIGAAAASLLMIAWVTTVAVMVSTFSISSALNPWILVLHLLSILVFPLAAVASLWNAWVTCTTRPGLGNISVWVWSAALAVSCLTLLWVAVVFHLIGWGVSF